MNRLAVLHIVFLVLTQREASGQAERPEGRQRRAEITAADPAGDAVEAGQRLLRRFAGNSKGEVPVGALREFIVQFEASEVRVLDLLRGWDADGNGAISRQEMKAGVMKAVKSLVDGKMMLDSDGDGVLSTAEYLLGLPPGSEGSRQAHGAAVDANGLTQRQREVMARQDRNQDGVVSREEVLATQAGRLKNGFALMEFTSRAEACDWNGDGLFDLREFAMVLGVKPGEDIPANLERQFLGRENGRATLSRGQFYDAFSHGMVAKLGELEGNLKICQEYKPR